MWKRRIAELHRADLIMGRSKTTFAHGIRGLDWSDLHLILAICRSESLSGAARTLGINHSTVSRKINAIEDKTGVRFFDRLPQGYLMTKAGHAAHEHAQRIEKEVDDLSRKILAQDATLSGPIRLTCSEGLAVELAPKLVAEFCKEHPDVSVHIEPQHTTLDLSKKAAEVAVRYAKNPAESAFGRKACAFRATLYSSRAYINKTRGISMADQNWCVAADTANWLVPLIFPSTEAVAQRTVMSSGSPLGVINAVASGQGNMVMACNLVDADLRLVRISENLEHLNMDVWILTHNDLRQTARIRALMTHLYDGISARRAEFMGKVRAGGVEILLERD
ncbi:MAG: LysR family transcriptional regulator [Boseongicola sp.]|nr:MAG: LysR family transcriptional regulator [Boseongicola sp.]